MVCFFVSLVDVLVNSGIAKSKSEAKRLIEGRGVSIFDWDRNVFINVVDCLDSMDNVIVNITDNNAIIRAGRHTFKRLTLADDIRGWITSELIKRDT